MPVRAVVFDLFITLTDFEAERLRVPLEAEVAALLGVDPGAFSALMRATFTERATGALGGPRDTLAELARRLGSDPAPETLDAAAALHHHHARQTVAPRPGVLEALDAIRRRGHRTGILTDCTAELVTLWPVLPYAPRMDAVTFSCEIGCRKPDGRGYADIVAKLGIGASECVYVGDGGSHELTGAAAAGMVAVLLETPFGPEERYDPEVGWTGPTVSDLAQLPALLDALAS